MLCVLIIPDKGGIAIILIEGVLIRMSIWLASVVPYEVPGLELMLIEQSARRAMINAGAWFAPGDTLI